MIYIFIGEVTEVSPNNIQKKSMEFGFNRLGDSFHQFTLIIHHMMFIY